MESFLSSSSLLYLSPVAPLRTFHPSFQLPAPSRHRPRLLAPPTALKSPRGFGPSSPQKAKDRCRNKRFGDEEGEDDDDFDDDDEEEEDDDDDDGTIPEVVTNRMMRRMGLSIGIPLALGLSFFPLFYYLKVVAKVDVPSWLPFSVSFVFFGFALLGVSYGIVSASWDPLREGSLLGWNEARRNWPVFWQSFRGKK